MKLYSLFAGTLLAFTLAACSGGDVKETLGLKKQSPDEFMIISRPPLSVPPDFNLRPPANAAGAKSQASSEAKSTLFKSASPATEQRDRSAGEASLLNQAAAEKANPDIRNLLEQEAKKKAVVEEEEEGFFSGIFSPIKLKESHSVVDVVGEEERIEKNLQEGKPISEGEVPTVESGPSSVLEQLLGD